VPVCVEGIERDSVHEAVVKLGCQLGQGWYFGKPMSAEKARELLAARGRDESDSNSIPRRNAASN